MVASGLNYGAPCGFSVALNTSVVKVPSGTMSLGVSYSFTVLVSSPDGRTDTAIVAVNPTLVGPQPSIIISSNHFNPTSKLVINGYVHATYAVSSNWTVFTDHGTQVLITSLTPQSRSFSTSDALSNVNYPLSVGPGVFIGGNTYTFRLTAHPSNSALDVTYAEIVLEANAAPTSGFVVAFPNNGSALVTEFLLSSPGWTADAENFPLSYSFSYSLSAASPSLTIAASSLRAFTMSTLPAGLLSQNNSITVQTQVTDIYFSFSTAVTPVHVTSKANIDIPSILDTSLKNAFALGNVDRVIQTVNNVSYMC